MTDRRQADHPYFTEKTIGLVLQGGGALGSYQAGVYEALEAADYPPDWVAGISIGAINAAIIAGNAAGDRVSKLRRFWDSITAPTALWPETAGVMGDWSQRAGGLAALVFGQPGFFAPRQLHEWFSLERPVSYYSVDALKTTLETLVDFDRINDPREMRLSVGAVNVRTGRFSYFDSGEITLRPEHVMASGALPPGFPPIEIDGEFYWDGGLVSNTPLQYVLDYVPRRSRLTFQVDVFQGRGRVPTDLEGVSERDKDIRYAGRTRLTTESFRERHEMRHAINDVLAMLPQEFRDSEEARRLYEFGCVTRMDVVQLIYRPQSPQGAGKDYDFSRGTMAARWRAGFADAGETLAAAPWLAPTPKEVGVRVFDVIHDKLTAKRRAGGTEAAEPRAQASD